MKFERHKIFFQVLCLYFLFVVGSLVYSELSSTSFGDHGYDHNNRRLLSLSNCTKRSVEEFPEDFMTRNERKRGGIIFHIALSAYLFMTLAIVCDDYFVSSLERICQVLGLKHDIAGATFMAMGGSAPELCTAVIGVFITGSDVGVSTIVGSAVFNVLCVTAICGIFVGKVVHLNWWPVFRDCISYCITVIALIIVLKDGLIYWYEGLIMLIIYAMYIVLLYNSNKVEKLILRILPISKTRQNSEYNQLLPQKDVISSTAGSSDDEEIMETVDSTHSHIRIHDDVLPIEGDSHSPFDIPDSFFSRIYWVTMLPITILCYITIPDCRKAGVFKKLFFLTFIMSLIWISATTYLLVWMICLTGDTLGIPDTIMGLTLLAAGASIPDAISAFLVVKEGQGDMAICSSIGSNILDILLGLGIPWLIKTGMLNPGSSIQIASSGLTYTSITLLATVVILVASLMLNKWKLNRMIGSIFFILYLAVLTFSCLYEMNVFGVFSLPPCPRTRS